MQFDNLKFKYLVERSGMSQVEVGVRIGVTASSVFFYEHGERVPKLDTYLKICELFELQPQDLITTDTNQPKTRAAKEARKNS